MKKEQKINEICSKEREIQAVKEWLGISFFVVAAIVTIMIYATLTSSMEDRGEIVVEKIISILSAFAGLLIFGYLYDKFLSKRLEILWEQRKMLF